MAKKATRLMREAAFEFRKNAIDRALMLAREAGKWALTHYQPRLKGEASRLIKMLTKIKERRDADGK